MPRPTGLSPHLHPSPPSTIPSERQRPFSRLGEAALTTFNHEALACRHAAIGHADLVEHLKIGLPAVRRHDVADIAALTVEELNVRVLLQQRLKIVVDVEAVAA